MRVTDRPVHAVRIDARHVRRGSGPDVPLVSEWRYWCICGSDGAWRATLAAAERDSWDHLHLRPYVVKDPD